MAVRWSTGWAVLVVLPCLDAEAARPYRVVATWGDTSGVTCLVPREDGLWVGTRGWGLARLDARGRVEHFDSTAGLPGNAVSQCLQAEGALWVATEAGLARLNKESGRFETASKGRFLSLAEAGGQVVAGRDDGVLVDGAGRERERLELVPAVMTGSATGALVVGSPSGEVFDSRDRRTLRLSAPVIGLRLEGEALVVETASGRLRREPGGALEPLETAPLPRSVAAELAWARISSEAQWDGRSFVGTDAGLWERRDGSSWCQVDLGGMPCGPRLTSLAWFGGALWVGGFDRGVCRFDGARWERFAGPGSLPSDLVNDLASDGERLYVATNEGMAIVDRALRFRQIGEPRWGKDPRHRGPWSRVVNGLAVDPASGEVWVADYVSVHRMGAKSWLHFDRRDGVTGLGLTRLAVRNGVVAVGTGRDGLHLGGAGGSFRTLDDGAGLPDNWVMDVAFDRDGRLWAATCTRGVGILEGETWRRLTSDEGLADDFTLAIAEVGDEMWVGTLRGVSIVRGQSVVSLDTSQGLSGDEVHDVLAVGDKVFLATEAGLTILEPVGNDAGAKRVELAAELWDMTP